VPGLVGDNAEENHPKGRNGRKRQEQKREVVRLHLIGYKNKRGRRKKNIFSGGGLTNKLMRKRLGRKKTHKVKLERYEGEEGPQK